MSIIVIFFARCGQEDAECPFEWSDRLLGSSGAVGLAVASAAGVTPFL